VICGIEETVKTQLVIHSVPMVNNFQPEVKGKALPVQAQIGFEDSGMLKLPGFQKIDKRT
jgi:hypothetical protein